MQCPSNLGQLFFIPRPFDVCVPLWASRLRLLTDGQPSLCVLRSAYGGFVPFLRPKKAAKSGKNREGKAGPYYYETM